MPTNRSRVVSFILAMVAVEGHVIAQDAWEAPRRLTRNGADSQTSINFARSVALDEKGRVHIVWIDGRDRNPEVYYKRSPDAGVSWGPPIRLTDDPGDSFNPSIAVAGDAVHVAWQDLRANLGARVYSRRSTDGGVTWHPESTLTPNGGGSPSVAVGGSTVHVVYGRPVRPGEPDVFYLRSLNGGETWEPAVNISNMPYSSWTPTIATTGEHVYVAWTDTFDAMVQCCQEEEYFAYSEDNGATWSDPVRLTMDPPGAMANSWAPSLAAFGPFVWIVWFDARDGNWEIYTKRSTDHGNNWSPDERLTFTAGGSVRPVIARRASELFVTYWETHQNGTEDVYLLHSDDLGAGWSAPQRLTQAPQPSKAPGVAAGAHGVHVAWTDARDGNLEVYHKRLPGQEVPVGKGRIAFNREVGGVPQIFTADPDGGNQVQLTFDGPNLSPAWSKDGTKLALTSARTGAPELWMMDADGSNQTRLTFTGQVNITPDWSYDGTRIAFASVRDGVSHPEIYVMNADGSDPTRLTFGPAGSGGSAHPSFSPQDEFIYFGSDLGGSTQVWGMLPDGQGQEQKTNGLGPAFPDANVPEWSRTGVLTLWSGIEGNSGEVWTWDIGGGEGPRRLTDTPDPLNSDNPTWSPDSSTILFDSNQGGGQTVNLWAVDASGGSSPTLLIRDAFGQSSWRPVFGACPADIDGSGAVGVGDLFAVIAGWGPCGVPCPGDLNGNGFVDIVDLLTVFAAWGPCP